MSVAISRQRGHAVFPVELSVEFLRYLPPPLAYMNRRVCRAWRDYVENVLVPRDWLPTLKIDIEPFLLQRVTSTRVLERENRPRVEYELMAQDGDIAVMKSDPVMRGLDHQEGERDWECFIPKYADVTIYMSGWVVLLVNEQFKPKWEGPQMLLPWRSLMRLLCRELYYYHGANFAPLYRIT